MSLLSILTGLTANAVKVKAAKEIMKAVTETNGGKVDPHIQQKIVDDLTSSIESPWWLSKRFGVVIINGVILIVNDVFQMGVSVEALQSITGAVIAYIMAKSYEQSK